MFEKYLFKSILYTVKLPLYASNLIKEFITVCGGIHMSFWILTAKIFRSREGQIVKPKVSKEDAMIKMEQVEVFSIHFKGAKCNPERYIYIIKDLLWWSKYGKSNYLKVLDGGGALLWYCVNYLLIAANQPLKSAFTT